MQFPELRNAESEITQIGCSEYRVLVSSCYNKLDHVKRVEEKRTVPVLLPLYSNGPTRCIFNNCTINDLSSIEKDLRNKCAFNRKVIVAKDAVVCDEHRETLVTRKFTAKGLIQQSESFKATPEELSRLLRVLMTELKNKHDNPLSIADMSEHEFKTFTGMSRCEYEKFKSGLDFSEKYRMRKSDVTLPIYLFKIKTGLSNKVIGTLFRRLESDVYYHLNRARKILIEQFVLYNLGLALNTAESITPPKLPKICFQDTVNSLSSWTAHTCTYKRAATLTFSD